jgi:C_GCAxxG_C_C family probable redox protein
MNRIEKAVNLKANGLANCCQAVTKAYADLTNLDEDTLNNLSSGFGQGMGCLEATCGALIGANIVLGLVNDKGLNTKAMAKVMLKDFEEKSGATICKVLKGVDTKVVLTPCNDCVKNACVALEKVLKDNKLMEE